jgi:hypothetical protein
VAVELWWTIKASGERAFLTSSRKRNRIDDESKQARRTTSHESAGLDCSRRW